MTVVGSTNSGFFTAGFSFTLNITLRDQDAPYLEPNSLPYLSSEIPQIINLQPGSIFILTLPSVIDADRDQVTFSVYQQSFYGTDAAASENKA